MRLNKGEIKTKVKGNMTAIVWKDKWNVNILMNMQCPPLQGNFCDKHGKAVKPAIIQDYSRHMGYLGKSDQMLNSNSRWTLKWVKKLFFLLLDLTILNSFTILASCGSRLSHSQFRMTLVKDLIQEAERVPWPQPTRQSRQAPPTSQLKRLDLRHIRHWLMQNKRICCHVCPAKKQRNKNKIQTSITQHIGLWATPYFEVYYNKLHFREPTDSKMEKHNTKL